MKTLLSTSVALYFSLCLAYATDAAFPPTPPCKATQLQSRVGPVGAGMGSQYTEIIFQNRSQSTCRLENRLHFEQLDDKGARMPLKLYRNESVNAEGAGSSEVILDPQQKTAITIQSSNRTGYDESRHCATQIQIAISAGLRHLPLITFKTISCTEEIRVSGFHPARELMSTQN